MFKAATGLNYRRFLKQLHEAARVDWYLEIGSRTGDSLSFVSSKSIVVDPYFKIEKNVIGTKPALHAFQETSDAFFASKFLSKNDIQLGLCFLDGMHLFEYLLRDFIGAEANAAPGGAILMHDCCPTSFEMTQRDPSNVAPGAAWTGDVWKIIPVLKTHRPDLRIDVLDCAPTGLVAVSGLNPDNGVLAARYNEILSEWRNLSLEDFGLKRFYDSFEFLPARQATANGFPFLGEEARLAGEHQPPKFASP